MKLTKKKVIVIYSVICLICFVTAILLKSNGLPHFVACPFVPFVVFISYQYFMRKALITKIEKLRVELNLSIEDVRNLANMGEYDLINWDFKHAYITNQQLNRLEDELDRLYYQEKGRQSSFKKYPLL